MFSTLIIIISLAAAAYFFYKDRGQAFTGSGWEREVNYGYFLKPILIVVLGIIIAAIQPYGLDRVDAGHVGIKVNLIGDTRGVSNYQYETGWVPYNNWTENLYEFPTYQQHIEYDEQTVITKGGFSAVIKPSFNYALVPDAVGDMFVNLRLGIREVEQGWLKTAIVGSVNDVANRWPVDSIFNNREHFEAAIVAECNKRVSQWFSVSQLRTNIIPPPALQKSIEDKTKALQEVQVAENQRQVAVAEAERKIAVARGDSAERVIRATADAETFRLKQKELTPQYIEFIKAEKWDGKLPSTILGGSNGIMLNLNK